VNTVAAAAAVLPARRQTCLCPAALALVHACAVMVMRARIYICICVRWVLRPRQPHVRQLPSTNCKEHAADRTCRLYLHGPRYLEIQGGFVQPPKGRWIYQRMTTGDDFKETLLLLLTNALVDSVFINCYWHTPRLRSSRQSEKARSSIGIMKIRAMPQGWCFGDRGLRS
jgi:hypothetical protein